ncbi:MAG: hypothetical protein JWP12_3804 [Bacteroidetes bacterium]|nr:hypothetical protein [Bacteroidota bacterium]
MRKLNLLFFFTFFSLATIAGNYHRGKDSTNIYQKVDTNYIENFRDLLSVKLFAVVRTNNFTVQDKTTGVGVNYTINTKLNMGISFTFKGVGVDLEYSPPGINNDDDKYGKTKQFALATSANGRRFMYDAYYRTTQGFHTTGQYTMRTATDTVYAYYKRPDITNYSAGVTLTYVVNNKRYSSGAPYSLSQKQKKGSGSLLIGTYAFLYGITADSSIYPDSLSKSFRHELQFSGASSTTFGLSCGYTYTFIFFRNWYANITTLPGISVQNFYSVNAYDHSSYSNVSYAVSLQSRLSIGYNRKNYFIGVSWINSNFFIDDNQFSSIQYKYGVFKFYYGHRFDVRKLLKKRL